MFYSAFVFLLSVCLFLFVSLLVTSRKNYTGRILMNILPEIYVWTKKDWFILKSNPHLDPDLAFFYNLAYISGKADRIFMNILS